MALVFRIKLLSFLVASMNTVQVEKKYNRGHRWTGVQIGGFVSVLVTIPLFVTRVYGPWWGLPVAVAFGALLYIPRNARAFAARRISRFGYPVLMGVGNGLASYYHLTTPPFEGLELSLVALLLATIGLLLFEYHWTTGIGGNDSDLEVDDTALYEWIKNVFGKK